MGLAEDHSHRGKRLSTWMITADWKEFAFLMDLDPEGKQVATIEAENAHKRDILFICCQEIFMLWIQKPDATWGNYYDSEQKDLAEQVN